MTSKTPPASRRKMMMSRLRLLEDMTGRALIVDRDSGGYRLIDCGAKTGEFVKGDYRPASPRLGLSAFISHINAMIDGAEMILSAPR